MWFWWFILICDCIIPVIMIIAGRMMWKHCPKKINGIVGYRTKMSMINMDTWKFAHDYAGKLWWKVGMLCILLVFSLSACGGDVSKLATHKVDSEIYSQEDINAAIDTIKKEFKSDWKGCTLTEIYYAGDDTSKDYQDWADRNNADEVIVLLSSFDVDSSGGDGSLNPDSTYNDWNWILVRTTGGQWQHVDHGY